jgi:molecular chaperone GrpE
VTRVSHDPTGARPEPAAATAQESDRRPFRACGEPTPDPAEETRQGPRGSERSPPASGPATAGLEETVRSQAARIDELTRAYASLLEDNKAFRQRMEREKERVLEAERVKVVQSLFEALDGLELAWNASRASGDPGIPALRSLSEGVRLILQGLAKRIAELGAERIEAVGRPFDPRLAEAVDVVVVTDPGRDEMVVEEMRPGWRMGDKVLRPARVRVGRLPRA